MIESRGLSRFFGGHEVLRDVNFRIAAGERVALLGRNGSGKTTLFRILTGLIAPTSGSAQINGHCVERQARSARQTLGFVPANEGSFFPRFTGRENLEFFANLRGLPGRELDRVLSLCAILGPFEKALETRYFVCSSGMKQSLAIARALLGKPQTLLLDEPTRSLDPETTSTLHAFLKNELEGTTVFFSTHSPDEARTLAHREIHLREGKIES